MGEVLEKMLPVPHHPGNASQNHKARSPPTGQNGQHKCWRGCGEEGTLMHWGWECKPARPLWKTVWSSHQKIKNRTTLPSHNSTSGYLPEENRNTNLKT